MNNLADTEPFEGPDGKLYKVDREQVELTPQDEDSEFDIDASTAWAYVDEAGNEYTFCNNNDDTITLLTCKNAVSDVVLPNAVQGKQVTAIAFGAFARSENLVSLTCPENAFKIHPNAFKYCYKLEKLVLPKNGTRVNRSWFKMFKRLSSLTLPDNLPSISSKLFISMAFDYLYIGAHTTEIETAAFNFCSIDHLEISPENTTLSTDGKSLFKNNGSELIAYYGTDDYYTIPEGCTKIGDNAFSYNKTLSYVQMPDSLTSIGVFAFSNSDLENFVAPVHLKEIQEKAFYFCQNLTSVLLNDELEYIGSNAFFKAPLKQIFIPTSVKEIDLHAFLNTDATGKLQREHQSSASFGITTAADNPYLFIDDQGALYKRTSEGLILLEMLSTEVRSYHIAEGTIAISDRAFVNHPNLESISLPEGLRVIGPHAFNNCKKLSSLTLPDSLESIGKEAFVKTALETINIPKHLANMGELALRSSGRGTSHSASGIHEITVHPENKVFFVEGGVLYQRKNNTVYAVQYIGPNEHVKIISECSHICTYAFAGLSTIKKLYLPNSITHIGYSGFMFEDAPEEIEIELTEPFDGHETVIAYFSQDITSNQSIRKAFAGTRINIPEIFMYSDRAILHTLRLYTRSKLAVQRLIDPVYASPECIEMFQSGLKKDLHLVCKEFAHNDFAKGFEYLIKLGFITQDNISEIVEAVNETNDVAMIGYLLELKHRHFGSRISLDLDI